VKIKVLKDILSANDQIAAKNRQLLDSQGILTINIMSSPGAGKTSLILETIARLKGKTRVGVIEGDVSSSVDAETVGKAGAPVVQINTGGGCHLDANMVNNAFSSLPLEDIDLLFIENVGNLICPAGFALGEDKKVVISSVSEGDDKPLKYPLMFDVADAVVVNKIDLLPHLKFNTQAYLDSVKGINTKVEVFQVSCTTGEGMERWVSWLVNHMKQR